MSTIWTYNIVDCHTEKRDALSNLAMIDVDTVFKNFDGCHMKPVL